MPAGAPVPVPAGASDDDDPWERAVTPSRGSSDPIGFYSRGCMRGAVALPVSGPGYEKMRLARHRAFGTPRLVEFLTGLGRKASAVPGLGRILVGDMGFARGGPFKKGHKSHQNGLDVDIWYRQAPAGTPVSDADREGWDSPSMVENDPEGFYLRLNPGWNPKELDILRLAASDETVQRVFVNPVIKKTACAASRGEPWLSKLRAEWGHDDYFHVRLRCDGPSCQPQDPVSGDGCGQGLDDEWFSDAARERWRKVVEDGRHPKPWRMPDLPAGCAAVLREP